MATPNFCQIPNKSPENAFSLEDRAAGGLEKSKEKFQAIEEKSRSIIPFKKQDFEARGAIDAICCEVDNPACITHIVYTEALAIDLELKWFLVKKTSQKYQNIS